MSKKISVRAGDGLKVFFPLRTIAAPGARAYVLEGETVLEVNGEDRFVVRRIQVGDLVVVQRSKPKPTPRKAAKSKTKSED